MDALVSTEWLAAQLGAPDLRIIDASHHALDPSRDPAAEYAAVHLPGARYLDLGGLADPDTDLPGMLPSAERFAAWVGARGVSDRDRIVIYDASPHRTSARAWWMFRLFGARQVAILDGGLAKWQSEARPVESGTPHFAAAAFDAVRDEATLRTIEQIKANLVSGAEQLLDARSAARFTGEEGDPRQLVAPGHIPGSRNLPYSRLLGPDGSFKPLPALAAEFAAAGIDMDRPLVTTCGSGVTAAILSFAAHLLGKRDVALYDGSWSEWGADPSTAKAVGP